MKVDRSPLIVSSRSSVRPGRSSRPRERRAIRPGRRATSAPPFEHDHSGARGGRHLDVPSNSWSLHHREVRAVLAETVMVLTRSAGPVSVFLMRRMALSLLSLTFMVACGTSVSTPPPASPTPPLPTDGSPDTRNAACDHINCGANGTQLTGLRVQGTMHVHSVTLSSGTTTNVH